MQEFDREPITINDDVWLNHLKLLSLKSSNEDSKMDPSESVLAPISLMAESLDLIQQLVCM